MSQILATRYAKAFIDEVYLHKDAKKCISAWQELAHIILGNEDLNGLLCNVTLSAKQKTELLAPILTALQTPDLVQNFIRVLAQNGRFPVLKSILHEMNVQYDLREGVQEVALSSAQKLDKPHQTQIQSQLAKALNKKVRLNLRVEEQLLGGLTVQLGSTVFDGSLRGRMNRMRTELMKE